MLITDQPKTFVIALEDHPVSRSQLNDFIKSAEEFNWKYEIHWAVDGRTITDESWASIGVTPLYHKGSMTKSGTWGCFFSHWQLWNKCIELNEPIIILEHDAIINDFWKPIDSLGCLVKLHENYTEKKQNKWIDPESGNNSSSAHAYCISPEHATKLINFSKKIGGYAVDRIIGDKVLSIMHLGRPTLVSRQNSFSTTENL
jgi:hypothetical protein